LIWRGFVGFVFARLAGQIDDEVVFFAVVELVFGELLGAFL
jgi:hypothetical protein